MGHGEVVDFVHFLESDGEVAVVDRDLRGTCDELDEVVHGLLIEALHDRPEPLDNGGVSGVAFVLSLADEHLD